MTSWGDCKTLNDFKRMAIEEKMNPDVAEYFMAAAGSNAQLRINETAFRRYRIRPMVLRDVSRVDIKTVLLGSPVACPIGISPTAFKNLVYPEGEIVTAVAASEEGCPMILSCLSVGDVDDIAEQAPNCVRWMQTYMFNDRSITEKIVAKAESTGFSALVVTVDSPVSGQWKLTVRSDLPGRLTSFHKITDKETPMKDIMSSSVTFDDLKWLKSVTKLPVVVKGILTGSDAVRSLKSGASAILVSNHGGRQIDGVCPTIEALGEIVSMVKAEDPTAEVYIDGGIRTGSDVFKALAMGAKAVFIGRPSIWGLAAGGKDGVQRILQILKNEFLAIMQLAGLKDLEDLDNSMISTSCGCCSSS